MDLPFITQLIMEFGTLHSWAPAPSPTLQMSNLWGQAPKLISLEQSRG